MQTVPITYRYLIYPTPAQVARLLYLLDACRLVYNLCNAHQTAQNFGSPLAVAALRPLLQQERRLSWVVKNIPQQLIDNTLFRSQQAWKRHIIAVRASHSVYRPAFKSRDMFTSLTWWAPAPTLTDAGLIVEGVQHPIRINLPRPISGSVKNVHVLRDVQSGRWYAAVVCDAHVVTTARQEHRIAVDFGLSTYVQGQHDGHTIDTPPRIRLLSWRRLGVPDCRR